MYGLHGGFRKYVIFEVTSNQRTVYVFLVQLFVDNGLHVQLLSSIEFLGGNDSRVGLVLLDLSQQLRCSLKYYTLNTFMPQIATRTYRLEAISVQHTFELGTNVSRIRSLLQDVTLSLLNFVLNAQSNLLLHIAVPLDDILVLGVGQVLAGKRLLQLVDHNVRFVDPHLGGGHLVRLLLTGRVEGADFLLQRRQSVIDVRVAHVRLPGTLRPGARRTGDWFAAAILAEVLVVVGVAFGLGLGWIVADRELEVNCVVLAIYNLQKGCSRRS